MDPKTDKEPAQPVQQNPVPLAPARADHVGEPQADQETRIQIGPLDL